MLTSWQRGGPYCGSSLTFLVASLTPQALLSCISIQQWNLLMRTLTSTPKVSSPIFLLPAKEQGPVAAVLGPAVGVQCRIWKVGMGELWVIQVQASYSLGFQSTISVLHEDNVAR